MKRKAPYIFGGLGIVLVVTSFVLRNGTPDADDAITTLASMFMAVAGGVCVLVGIVTFFMRHEGEDW